MEISIGLSITQAFNQSRQAVEHSMLFIRRDPVIVGHHQFYSPFSLLHTQTALYWPLPYNIVVGMFSFPHLMLGSVEDNGVLIFNYPSPFSIH